MKRTFIALLLFGCITHITAQNSSTRDTTIDSQDKELIPVSSKKFTKSATAAYLRKSKLVEMGVYIDPQNWGVNAGSISENAEFKFIYKNKDLFASMLTESSTFDLNDMRNNILNNLRDSDPEAAMVGAEFRMVNGAKVLYTESNFMLMKVPFTTYEYCYSNESGTMQLSVTTAKKKKEAYFDIIQTFLNGFTVLPVKVSSSLSK